MLDNLSTSFKAAKLQLDALLAGFISHTGDVGEGLMVDQ